MTRCLSEIFFKKNVHQVWCVFGGIWNWENQIWVNSPINQPKFLKNVCNNFWVTHFSNFWRYVCCRWFLSPLFVEDWGMLAVPFDYSPIPIPTISHLRKLDQESSGWNVKMVEMGKSLSSAFMANSGYRPAGNVHHGALFWNGGLQ